MALLFSLPLDLLSLLLSDWCRPKDIVRLDGVLKGRWRRIFLSALGTVTDYPPWHARDLIGQDISMFEWMRTRNYSVVLEHLLFDHSDYSDFCGFIPHGSTYPFVRMINLNASQYFDEELEGEDFVKQLFTSFPNLVQIDCSDFTDDDDTSTLEHLVKFKHLAPNLRDLTITCPGIRDDLLAALGVLVRKVAMPTDSTKDLRVLAALCPNIKSIELSNLHNDTSNISFLCSFAHLEEIVLDKTQAFSYTLQDIQHIAQNVPNLKTFTAMLAGYSGIQFVPYMIQNCSNLSTLHVNHLVYEKDEGYLGVELDEDLAVTPTICHNVIPLIPSLRRLLIIGKAIDSNVGPEIDMLRIALENRKELEVLELTSAYYLPLLSSLPQVSHLRIENASPSSYYNILDEMPPYGEAVANGLVSFAKHIKKLKISAGHQIDGDLLYLICHHLPFLTHLHIKSCNLGADFFQRIAGEGRVFDHLRLMPSDIPTKILRVIIAESGLKVKKISLSDCRIGHGHVILTKEQILQASSQLGNVDGDVDEVYSLCYHQKMFFNHYDEVEDEYDEEDEDNYDDEDDGDDIWEDYEEEDFGQEDDDYEDEEY